MNSTDKQSKIVKLRKILTIISLFVMLEMLFAVIYFASDIVTYYDGLTDFALLFGLAQIVVLALIIVFFFVKKMTLKKLHYILLFVFAGLCFAQIVLAVVGNYCFIYDYYYELGSGVWEPEYFLREYYGSCYETWIIMGLSCAMLLLTTFVILFNWLTRKKGVAATKKESVVENNEVVAREEKIAADQEVKMETKREKTLEVKQEANIEEKPTASLEKELLQVKKLLDKNLITEEESKKMRENIIAKYLK